MSLENELTSDIAVALLTAKDKDPQELNRLKELVLKIHSELRDIPRKSLKRRAHAPTSGGTQKN
jgi:hypothetical protein